MAGVSSRMRQFSRRSFLTTLVIGGAGTVLAACSSAAPAPTAAPTQAGAPAQQPTSAQPAAAAPTAAPTATPAAAQQAAAAPTPTAAPAQQAASSGPKVEVDFWNPWDGKFEKKTNGDLVDAYNQQSTKVTVKNTLAPDSNHFAKYTTAIASGKPPGAIETSNYTPIVEWAS